MKKLIEYIITEPTEDDYNLGHKFPFLAIETLSCETVKVHEIVLRNENKSSTQIQNEDLKMKETKKYLNHSNPDGYEEEEIEEMITVEENSKSDLKTPQENQIKFQSIEYSGDNINKEKEEESKETFFKNELLEFFFSFLERTSELNHVLAGYFSRFINYLYNKNATIVCKIMNKIDSQILIYSTT